MAGRANGLSAILQFFFCMPSDEKAFLMPGAGNSKMKKGCLLLGQPRSA
jgi:hypothetical protein